MTADPLAARSRWGQPARLALGTASALGLARFAYGLILPAMRSELGWSLAQAGALTTANAVGYLLARHGPDRCRARRHRRHQQLPRAPDDSRGGRAGRDARVHHRWGDRLPYRG